VSGPPSERIAILKSFSLLAGASKDTVESLVARFEERKFAPNQTLVREGTMGSEMFVIAVGQCEVRKGDRRVAMLGPGQLFGEMSVLLTDPRSATVLAVTDVTTYVLGGWAFREALHADPSLGLHIMRTLASRLKKAEHELASLKARP
jgi:CRP-like cAMP-binding protein